MAESRGIKDRRFRYIQRASFCRKRGWSKSRQYLGADRAMVNPFDLKAALFAKHAQHVVLIHFPIALYSAAVVFDFIAERTRRPGVADAAYYNLLFAAVSTLAGLVGAFPGATAVGSPAKVSSRARIPGRRTGGADRAFRRLPQRRKRKRLNTPMSQFERKSRTQALCRF